MFFLVAICTALSLAAGEVNNTYFITAPSVFRPGQPFRLRVALSNAVTLPVDITAGIMDQKQKRLIVSQSDTFGKGPSKEMTLQIPHGVAFTSVQYQLSVNGTGGVKFSELRYIRFMEKGFTIYIQTDKAIYKPGQNVLMRIFGVHPNLKVYTGNLTVDILDPNGNKMAHWVNLNSQSGVIKREFLLSTQPVEGEWKISVTAAEDQKAEQVIEVKPYVLPKFEVKVNLPAYVIEKESKLTGAVDVKYTYGKGAKGRANVQIYFNSYGPKKISLAKDIPVNDGRGTFSFDKKVILQLFQDSFQYEKDATVLYSYAHIKLEVNATFHEDLTGKVASGQGSVSFYQMDVKLQFAEFNPKNFKPGLPFKVLLQVVQPNGEPVSPDRLKKLQGNVKITTKYDWKGDGTDEFLPHSDDGSFIITKDIPSSAQYLSLQAEYSEGLRQVMAYFSASKSESPSNSFLQLSTTTSSVKAGDNIALDVEATFTLSELKYMVVARGMSAETGTHVVSPGSTKTSFTIPSKPGMAPTARLLVYSMLQGGEIVVDSLNVKIEDPFQNQVSVTIDTNNKDSVSPGDTVTIKGKATPGSFMAFRAVDKSVLLMKEDTDLSVRKVLEDLQSYDSAQTWYPFWEWGIRRSRRMIMPFPTSGRSAARIFENSGVIVITNYNLPGGYDDYMIMYGRRPVMEGAADSDVRIASADGGGAKPKLAEVKRVRSLFPETWIWLEYDASSAGEVEFQRAVPDTLTTWVASAFAVSNSTGLGVGELKPQVQVFQSFFVSLNLPYSVVRGEEVALQVTVFNYESEAQLVTITLKGSKDWAIIDEVNKLGLRGENSVNKDYVDKEMDLKVEITVGAGQGKAVSFPVVPRTLGLVPIEVRAQSSRSADAVKRNLLVEPEGVPQEYSISMLLDLNSTSSLSHTVALSVPPNTVKGSARATVSVMGDILGSSINNLDQLVRMPYGCGEQNMVNFAPNIYVMKYLKTVNQLTQSIQNKAKNFMIAGYQREQTYRHKEGSYSAFGERDGTGSMWLTAFVAKSFAQARAFIPEYIDDKLLEESLAWMARQTNRDGSIKKVGQVHSSVLKGGQTGVISLTAYVLIALAEANSKSRAVINAKNNAITFLENKVNAMSSDIKDSYTLAITAYVLSLVGSAKKTKALTELRKMAIEKDGLIYWEEKQDVSKPSDNPWFRPYYRPRSADIEITAYALLAYSVNKDISVGLPISRWLSQQRNSMGGYSSTQDTVVGLQALSEFAELIYTPDIDFTVQLSSSADSNFRKIMTVNQQNSMVLQLVEIPNVAGSLSVSANGRGIGMLQVGVTYNVDKAPDESSFDFLLEVIRETKYEIEVKACSMWSENDQDSGMAVMDVGIPSGFELDWNSVEKIMSDPSLKLKRVESPDRKVLFYFDEIPSSRMVCVTVTFQRAYDVGKPQPSSASVYSYYEPGNRAAALYAVDSLADQGVCRVCPDCVNCEVRDEPTGQPKKSSAPGLMAAIGSGGMALLSLMLLVALK
ncbi:CD109 antigen-like isoform X2 [Oculina patagonica]